MIEVNSALKRSLSAGLDVDRVFPAVVEYGSVVRRRADLPCLVPDAAPGTAVAGPDNRPCGSSLHPHRVLGLGIFQPPSTFMNPPRRAASSRGRSTIRIFMAS